MSGPANGIRHHRAKAARQALALCETTPAARPWISAAAARAALRAADLPPLAAAALRGRLRLIPDQEAKP